VLGSHLDEAIRNTGQRGWLQRWREDPYSSTPEASFTRRRKRSSAVRYGMNIGLPRWLARQKRTSTSRRHRKWRAPSPMTCSACLANARALRSSATLRHARPLDVLRGAVDQARLRTGHVVFLFRGNVPRVSRSPTSPAHVYGERAQPRPSRPTPPTTARRVRRSGWVGTQAHNSERACTHNVLGGSRSTKSHQLCARRGRIGDSPCSTWRCGPSCRRRQMESRSIVSNTTGHNATVCSLTARSSGWRRGDRAEWSIERESIQRGSGYALTGLHCKGQ